LGIEALLLLQVPPVLEVKADADAGAAVEAESEAEVTCDNVSFKDSRLGETAAIFIALELLLLPSAVASRWLLAAQRLRG